MEPVCEKVTPPAEARCPTCSAFLLDAAGLTVAYCSNCKACTHPATRVVGGRDVCVACGQDVGTGEPD